MCDMLNTHVFSASFHTVVKAWTVNTQTANKHKKACHAITIALPHEREHVAGTGAVTESAVLAYSEVDRVDRLKATRVE